MSEPDEPGSEGPSFQDHFSRQAAGYARYRPRYPKALFDEIASHATHRRLAWDCATGSGQAAIAWADHFDDVVATDASDNQIAHAQAHPRIRYTVAPAEQSGLEAGSVDLVGAAAAAHWFEHDAFHREVRRVTRAGALVALFSYAAEVRITEAVDTVFHQWAHERLAEDWPERYALVRARYQTLPFPFEELPVGDHVCSATWTLEDAVGVFSTWSATQRAIDRTGRDVVDEFRSQLREAWPDPSAPLPIAIPLFCRLGRVR